MSAVADRTPVHAGDTPADDPALRLSVRGLAKTFVLHPRGGVSLPVFAGVDLDVRAGECVALAGPSGSGKSTLMRCLYGNYAPTAGVVRLRGDDGWLELSSADPRDNVEARRTRIGYVSQFLRVIPRVPAESLVAEPLRRLGSDGTEALDRARALLARLNLGEHLWRLPPATFSGGEQQRVNVARGLIAPRDVLLLDEPTASLDVANRDVVVGLIRDALTRGTAIVGIFHDEAVRAALVTRAFEVAAHRAATPSSGAPA